MKRTCILIDPETSAPTPIDYPGRTLVYRWPDGRTSDLECRPIRTAAGTVYVYAMTNEDAQAGVRRL
jgi:hypothetical protein